MPAPNVIPHLTLADLMRDQPELMHCGLKEFADAIQRAIEPAAPLLTPRDAATFLGLSEKTLAQWRWRGEGPCHHKLGRAIRYERSELESWIAAGRRTSTSAVIGRRTA